VQHLQESADSAGLFYQELLVGGTNVVVMSNLLFNPADYVRLELGGGLEWKFQGFYIPGFHEVRAWLGAGVRTGVGDGATATIDTSYRFNAGGSLFGDANTTTLTASSATAPKFEGGVAFTRELQRGVRLVVEIGATVTQNTRKISAEASSSKTLASPGGVITFSSNAGVYQVPNVSGVTSSMSFEAPRMELFHGTGPILTPTFSFGLEWSWRK
jgi:hypothetical protein